MLRPVALVLVSLLAAAPALARGGGGGGAADLQTTVIDPSGVSVYDTATWQVRVDNVGRKDARGVEVEIQLPETNTSPTVHVMGDVSGVPGSCSAVGTTLVCSLGKIRKGSSASVSFDLNLPVNDGVLIVEAEATTSSSESSTSNNVDAATASLASYSVAFSAPVDLFIEHCTGTALTSFYECELYPSSISSHETTLNADGSISFAGNPPGYTGSWSSSSANELSFTYFFNGSPVAVFSGVGADLDCWEGVTDFGNGYVAPYRVCTP